MRLNDSQVAGTFLLHFILKEIATSLLHQNFDPFRIVLVSCERSQIAVGLNWLYCSPVMNDFTKYLNIRALQIRSKVLDHTC